VEGVVKIAGGKMGEMMRRRLKRIRAGIRRFMVFGIEKRRRRRRPRRRWRRKRPERWMRG
jgi:hypothetical protein